MSGEEYTLEELLKILEEIKQTDGGYINLPMALMTLAKEIEKLKPRTSEEFLTVS